ncbi:predicted protein [Postia placenta Mad-698-R]|nr:predicted protein [Postia placenta Mad-698-R]
MSAADALSEYIQSYRYSIIDSYIQIAATCVFIYDCFITLDQERQVVWERKITGAGVIYLALRYTSLLNAIANIADDIIISCEPEVQLQLTMPSFIIFSAYIVGILSYVALCCMYLVQAAFAAIRVYAIQGNQWPMAVIIMMLGLVPVATNTISDAGGYCYIGTTTIGFPYNNIALHTSVCDRLESARSGCDMARHARYEGPLGEEQHQGVARCLTVQRWQESFDLTQPVELINTLVLCRFFLDLRRLSSTDDSTGTSAPSFSSFASRVIGDLGGMLDIAFRAPSEDSNTDIELDDSSQLEYDASHTTTSPTLEGGSGGKIEMDHQPSFLEEGDFSITRDVEAVLGEPGASVDVAYTPEASPKALSLNAFCFLLDAFGSATGGMIVLANDDISILYLSARLLTNYAAVCLPVVRLTALAEAEIHSCTFGASTERWQCKEWRIICQPSPAPLGSISMQTSSNTVLWTQRSGHCEIAVAVGRVKAITTGSCRLLISVVRILHLE